MQKIFDRLFELMGDQKPASFARKCGIKQQTFDPSARRIRIPSTESVIKICTSCGVSADWLLGLSDSKTVGASGITQTATGGSIAANNSFNAPTADLAHLEELLETQRALIATQQRLIEALSERKK